MKENYAENVYFNVASDELISRSLHSDGFKKCIHAGYLVMWKLVSVFLIAVFLTVPSKIKIEVYCVERKNAIDLVICCRNSPGHDGN